MNTIYKAHRPFKDFFVHSVLVNCKDRGHMGSKKLTKGSSGVASSSANKSRLPNSSISNKDLYIKKLQQIQSIFFFKLNSIRLRISQVPVQGRVPFPFLQY